MESSTAHGLTTHAQPARPGPALVLAVLSVPGSTVAWELFDGAGFVIGVPLAVAAIVLGIQARQRSAPARTMATAAIVIAAAMLTMTAVWSIAASV